MLNAILLCIIYKNITIQSRTFTSELDEGLSKKSCLNLSFLSKFYETTSLSFLIQLFNSI